MFGQAFPVKINNMTQVLKPCHRLGMSSSHIVKLLFARKIWSLRPRTPFTYQSTVPLNTCRLVSGGQRCICSSSLMLGSPSQNYTAFKWNPGNILQDKELSEGSEDQSKFNYANSKFRKTLFTVGGGILLGGFVLMSPTLLAKEEEGKDFQISSSEDKIPLEKAIQVGKDLVQRIKDESGSPGLVVAVTVDGMLVWEEGFGYADVENRVLCTPRTILRIASVSKPITMAAVARLWEQGLLDLDKPVQHYVPEFPEKTWNGEKVTITTRQLLCHMAGVRHYDKDYMKDNQSKEGDKKGSSGTKMVKDEVKLDEYFSKDNYPSVIKSLDMFKDDPLVKKPGSEFYYTTHGWTLISAVVEKAAKMPFEKYLRQTLKDLGLNNTFLEQSEPLVYNRGRHYVRNDKGKLENAAYVDLSHKWAGGGLVSNVFDLVKFGNIMLYCYQGQGCHGSNSSSTFPPGFLKPETVKDMWTVVVKRKLQWGCEEGGYGLGWGVWDSAQKHGYCKERQCYVSHTGNALGGSSVLLILPSQTVTRDGKLPKGVVVTVIVNMVNVNLQKTAFDLAKVFDKIDSDLLS